MNPQSVMGHWIYPRDKYVKKSSGLLLLGQISCYGTGNKWKKKKTEAEIVLTMKLLRTEQTYFGDTKHKESLLKKTSRRYNN